MSVGFNASRNATMICGCFHVYTTSETSTACVVNYVGDDALIVTSLRSINKHVNKHTWPARGRPISAAVPAADAVTMAIGFPSDKTGQQVCVIQSCIYHCEYAIVHAPCLQLKH